jgi:hypothetical protein
MLQCGYLLRRRLRSLMHFAFNLEDLPSNRYNSRKIKVSAIMRHFVSTCLLLSLLAPLASSQVDYSQYVNPLIGSEGPIPGLAFGGG